MAAATEGRHRVLIAGGGVAGLEAAMALTDLAGDRIDLALISPDREFMLKALYVRAPFTHEGPRRHQIGTLLEELGVEGIADAVARVEPAGHRVELADGGTLGYESLIVCVGGRPRPAFTSAETFWPGIRMGAADSLIERAATSPENRLAVVVPPGVHWALPAYELALLMRRRADDSGRRDLAIEVLTPEAAPLAAFGGDGSEAVARILRARRIDLRTSTVVTESEDADGLLADGAPLGAATAIALPQILGPSIEGLPLDDAGFIPVDEHCRVEGVADVYAAGDGTSSLIKQGGLAAQQADAAAEHLAASLGAPVSPQPFDPVLRGELLTGSTSLKMLHRLADVEDVGEVSRDHLWWPRKKVAGRYLSAWLAGRDPAPTLDPHELPLEVEVATPDEWHGRPLLEHEP